MNKYFVDFPRIAGLRLVKAQVPGSKSITNRALLLAAMGEGGTRLTGCLASEDGQVLLEGLRALGFRIETTQNSLNQDVTIQGEGGQIPRKEASLTVGRSGTAARFLLAILAFSEGIYLLDADEQMRKRPIKPLLDALKSAGARVECLEEEDHFPLRIRGAFYKDVLSSGDTPILSPATGIPLPDVPTEFTVEITESSQYLSALMIAAAGLAERLGKPITIHAKGRHGLSYITMTASLLREFGIPVCKVPAGWEEDGITYIISNEREPKLVVYPIEQDMSAASYFYALAAVLGISVEVEGVRLPTHQGDEQFLKVLETMGCSFQTTEEGILQVTGPVVLKGGFTVDMSSFSDQALTLAAIAPYADGPISITGIDYIRIQESDRVLAILHNLRSMGIRVDESVVDVATKSADCRGEKLLPTTHQKTVLTIYPGRPQPCEIETYEDHRVAMAFALSGLKANGIVIKNPECCQKTFAEFFTVLDEIKKQLLQ